MKYFSMKIPQQILASFVIVWMSFLSPAMALAQEAVDANGNPTGTSEGTGASDNGATECTGAGCGQGVDQGIDQGVNQGIDQGVAQGDGGSEVTAENTNTGADSTNNIDSDVLSTDSVSVDNDATDNTTAGLTGNTGGNDHNGNTGDAATTTGNAGIGVTSVKNDNTAVIGGSAGLDVNGYNGDYLGDLLLSFGGSTANLSGGQSVQATNDTTGSGSTNGIDLDTSIEEVNEVQNDGQILNDLLLSAITGQNDASGNTGDASISTGNANIAATLVNLLNTTVINGNLMISVADIFGDLTGNIVLPDLAALAAALFPQQFPNVVATNENTGFNSNNTINADFSQTETTDIDNDADVTTNLTANAITGQNEATANTGGGLIETGDGSASLTNMTLANTTIEGGNWALVVVNALNRWLGFLVGDNGQIKALSQEETLELANRNTGANSDNTIDVTQDRTQETTVGNNAVITNDVTANAITGQNTANGNTGVGEIETGDANVEVTAFNIANTTVKDGSLFIAVVNIFGNWFGDLLYGGNSLLASAGSASSNPTVSVDASNERTGSESTNTIDVNYDRDKTTDIDNNAQIATNLTANIDTGTNKTNQNTLGGNIKTGDGVLALHSRALANLTGIGLDPALGFSITGLNERTGFDSENTINATLNDTRLISIDNFADVDTLFASLVNTGNNEANQNTVGGNIKTGNIDATASIHNLVNRVILALSGGLGLASGDHLVIDADFLNHITGALSENSNSATANYDLTADITNAALIDNLLRLLFNTGANQANENTLGAAVSTGRICFEGEVENVANKNSLDGAGLFGIDLTNNADVNNVASIGATTGNNETNDNTKGGTVDGSDGCPQLAQAPTPTPGPAASPTPTPTPGGNGGSNEDHGGQGGGEQGGMGGGEVASAVSKKPQINHGQVLRRFPVAGSVVEATWLTGKKPVWPAFVIGALAILGVAYHFDRQSRQHGGQARRQRLTIPV